jgi:hypothetical protein
LTGNAFTGSLPSEYSSMERLRVFVAAINLIEGTLPPSYASMTGMVSI